MFSVPGYNLIEQVGSGSFGVVFSAIHIKSMQKVAIKIVERKTIVEQQFEDKFQRELDFMKKVDHPFIVHCFEIIETETSVFIVMEYVSHGSLLNKVSDEGFLSEVTAKNYICQLVAAVKYLHEELKIIHRDLKFENIMLDRTDNIRLVDFGLSNQLTTTQELLSSRCGSPPYLSPEIVQDIGYNYSTDIWSIGIITYACLTGEFPFNAPNIQLLFNQILYKTPEYPEELSTECIDYFESILQKKPENRITMQNLCCHPWLQGCDAAKFLHISFETNPEFFVNEKVLDPAVVERLADLGIPSPAEDPESIVPYRILKTEDIKRRIRMFRPKSNRGPIVRLKSDLQVNIKMMTNSRKRTATLVRPKVMKPKTITPGPQQYKRASYLHV